MCELQLSAVDKKGGMWYNYKISKESEWKEW